MNLRMQVNNVKFKEAETTISTTEEGDFHWDMCLNKVHRQARLNDVVRQKNMCGNASSSGRRDGFFLQGRDIIGQDKNDVLA